ncbi:MAG: thiamine pyrophosphate-binding protein [Alphaproteobacteria bacterium]
MPDTAAPAASARTGGSPYRGKVADAIAATLKAYGARFAFGIPGNDVLELIRALEEQGVTYVLAKSEPAAAFMADAVYQLTGTPAVLIPALGPGVANAMAGIAGALMERTAMLVLSGEMATPNMAIYNHQVFDHVALAAPLTKLAMPLNPARAAQQTARALDIATAYPAGPVLLNCPADHSRADSKQAPDFAVADVLPGCLSDAAAATLRTRIAASRQPLALIGRGALMDGIREPLGAFLEAWGIPFFQTYKTKGLIDERHPLSLGAAGLSPVVDAEAMRIVKAADLILPIGFDPIELRDAWLDAWDHARPCITIDRGVQTHRIFPTGTQAVGDIAAILGQLMPATARTASWPAAFVDDFRSKVAHILRPRTPAHGISPAALFRAVSDRATPDWVMTVDVGAHRILASHAIQCQSPGQLVQSNGLCCMGYAVPAAIGAKLACPERPVVALVGDGCMQMSLGELAVAAERQLPMVVVVLNDQALALIKLKQSKMQMEPRAVDFGATRFDKVAEGLGAAGVRVETQAEFEAALEAALASNRLTVIDAVVDPSEYWEQM